ncbi:uncharacterized protein LOC105436969 [Strongylocentrotus purpuratus]|uniref:Uncharacterized protein n=1 Tax=Strongylocentrotus purpuratus TaxID=7668 RepID=A0A7M7HEY6_STRPU|nr:uncharacterized protein LOC105436969 [Strongylocentrotus purpuratus]
MKVLLIFLVVTFSSWSTCGSIAIPRTVQSTKRQVDKDSIHNQLVKSEDTFLGDRLLSDQRRVQRVTRDDDEEVIVVDAEEGVEESKIVDESGGDSDDEKEKGFREKMHGWLRLVTGIYVFICVVLCALAILRYVIDGCPCLQQDFC